jgi:hypothetical protein
MRCGAMPAEGMTWRRFGGSQVATVPWVAVDRAILAAEFGEVRGLGWFGRLDARLGPAGAVPVGC